MGVGATTMPGVPRLARAVSKVPSEHNTEHVVSTCLPVCYSFHVLHPLVSSLRERTVQQTQVQVPIAFAEVHDAPIWATMSWLTLWQHLS